MIHSRYPAAGVEAQDGFKPSSVTCNATSGNRRGSINHLTSINRPSAINSPIKVHTALLITHGSRKASVSSANQLFSSSRAFGTWWNKSKIIAVSISSAQPKPAIAKRSNLRRSRLSKTVRIGVRFRFTALHAPASGDKRKVPASRRSRPAEFRISRFFMELPWRRKTNQITYDTSALKLVSTPREKRQKLVSAVFPQPIITVFKNIHVDQPLDSTETDDEAISLIRDFQALFKCGSFSRRSKLLALIVPICSSHGRPFWSPKINLLYANKQPTQTNFQLAAKQQIQTSNRRLKTKIKTKR